MENGLYVATYSLRTTEGDGLNTIIYLAAITGINLNHEAAEVDGVSHKKDMAHYATRNSFYYSCIINYEYGTYPRKRI